MIYAIVYFLLFLKLLIMLLFSGSYFKICNNIFIFSIILFFEFGKVLSFLVINVKSEIGPLKKVLLHRPGGELLNLTPDTLEELLFDDIPYLTVAMREHDNFADILRQSGTEVIYLEDLVAETLTNPEIRNQFLIQFIREAELTSEKDHWLLLDFFSQIRDPKELVLKTMQGVKRDELTRSVGKIHSLSDYMSRRSGFICNPMPNLYFTRDAFACIGNGVTLNRMRYLTRRRETIYGEYIFRFNPRFAGLVDIYYSRYDPFCIEGGDILNLNAQTLAIGVSQRTSPEAIEALAKNIFSCENTSITQILAFDIPNNRAMMHLDTVFTQVDYDKFTVYNGLSKVLRVYKITPGAGSGELKISEVNQTLEHILASALNRDSVTLIPCGGNDRIVGEREQWNDGSNTLCVRPGTVIVYQRNEVTNDILREHGLNVLELSGSELSRGRGGPRCMSMPIYRDDI